MSLSPAETQALLLSLKVAFWSVAAHGKTAWAVGPRGVIVTLAF